MELPVISAKTSFHMSSGGPLAWERCAPSPAWASSKMFLHKLARDHFQRVAELDVLLTQAFFQGLPDLAPRDRSRYVDALYLVVRYLTQSGLPAGTCCEFLELAAALKELDRGTVRWFLQKEKASGAPPEADDIWIARAYLAIVLDMALKQLPGMKKNALAAQLAKATDFMSDTILTKGNDFEGSLQQWHTNFQNRTVANKSAQEVFDRRFALVERYQQGLNSRDLSVVSNAIITHTAMVMARSMTPDQLARAVERNRRAQGYRKP